MYIINLHLSCKDLASIENEKEHQKVLRQMNALGDLLNQSPVKLATDNYVAYFIYNKLYNRNF